MIELMSMNRWHMIFFSGYLILPYLIFPWHFSPYEPIKVYFLVCWSMILTIAGNWQRKSTDKHLPSLLLLLLAILIGSSAINANLSQAFLGNPYRSDGLFALTALMILALNVAQNWDDKYKAVLITISRINAIVVPTLALLFPNLSWLFGNPLIMSGYSVMLLPLSIQRISDGKADLFWRISCAIAVGVVIIVVQSWGAVLVYLLLFAYYFFGLNWKMLISIMIILGVVASGYFIENMEKQFASESRQRIIMKGLIAITHKPIFGWGWSNFSFAFTTIDYPEYYKIDAQVDRPHAAILDYAVSGGVPALLVYAYIVLISFKKLSLQNNNPMWLTVLAMYLIHSQTNVTSVGEDIFFWLAVGQAMRAG